MQTGKGASRLHQITALERQLPDIPLVGPPNYTPSDTMDGTREEYVNLWTSNKEANSTSDNLFKHRLQNLSAASHF